MQIEDNGPGVAEEHYDRIFQPFFTTKQDVGTGLGLWVTREILERHNGIVNVGPRKNAQPGAAFTVILPAIPDTSHQSVVL